MGWGAVGAVPWRGLGFKSCILTAEVAQPGSEGLSWSCRAEATIHDLGSLLPTLAPPTEIFPFSQGVGARAMVDRDQEWLRPLIPASPSFCLLRREIWKKSPIGMVSQAQCTPRRVVHRLAITQDTPVLLEACPSGVGWAFPE